MCLFNKHTLITMFLDSEKCFTYEHKVVLDTLIAAVTTVFGSVVDEEMPVNIMHRVRIETRNTARVALPLIVSLVGPSNVASISLAQQFINDYLLECTVYFISNFSVTKSNMTCSSF